MKLSRIQRTSYSQKMHIFCICILLISINQQYVLANLLYSFQNIILDRKKNFLKLSY